MQLHKALQGPNELEIVRTRTGSPFTLLFRRRLVPAGLIIDNLINGTF